MKTRKKKKKKMKKKEKEKKKKRHICMLFSKNENVLVDL